MGRKISPKIQLAAEKYLTSLGSSREQLTDKQWEIIANYVKTRRMKVPILLTGGIFCACMGFLYSWYAKNHIANILPDEAVFVSKANKESAITLKPDDIKEHIDYLTHAYFMAGSLFILTVFMLGAVSICIPLMRRGNRKMLKAFIPRKQERGAARLENQISSE
jgi:hypothetical protein